MKVCSKDGCGSKAKARGLCNRHYLQYLHAGGEKKVVLFGPLEDRWHKLYSVDEKTGCWVWQGHVTPKGCPVVSDKNKRRPATQISYEKLHGPIPAGYFVWRTCKTHGCIKPEHLSLERPSTPVSQYELDYRKFLLDYTALEKRSFALMRFDPKSVVADVDDWGEAVCFKVAGHCVIVDADRFEEVMKHKWYIWLADKRRMHPCPYWDAPDGKGKLSRLILPCPERMVVDHINHDTLDNRLSNLRIATRSENCWNQRKVAAKSSIYKGVSWNRLSGKWLAQIAHNYKRTRIGYFDSEEEAALAYNREAARLHGNFAHLNKVKPISATG